MKKTFKYDLIIILLIVVFICGLFFIRDDHHGEFVRITLNNQEYGIYNLNDEQTININNENILIIKNHEIYMDKATCPDKTCIHQGHISKKGASIICLPHKLIVEIIEGQEDKQDGQVY